MVCFSAILILSPWASSIFNSSPNLRKASGIKVDSQVLRLYRKMNPESRDGDAFLRVNTDRPGGGWAPCFLLDGCASQLALPILTL